MTRTLLPLFLAPLLLAAAAPTTRPSTPAGWVAWRDGMLKSIPSAPPIARDEFVRTLIPEIKPYLIDTDPNARLNTAILFAKFETLSSDAALVEMLKNPDPAVRLWGAKGLDTLAPKLKAVGSAKYISALKAALAAESQAAVKSELTKTLGSF